jgi:hypothetical protein
MRARQDHLRESEIGSHTLLHAAEELALTATINSHGLVDVTGLSMKNLENRLRT